MTGGAVRRSIFRRLLWTSSSSRVRTCADHFWLEITGHIGSYVRPHSSAIKRGNQGLHSLAGVSMKQAADHGQPDHQDSNRRFHVVLFGFYLVATVSIVAWFLFTSAMLPKASWSVIDAHKNAIFVAPLLWYFHGTPKFARAACAAVFAIVPAIILSVQNYWIPAEGRFLAVMEYGPLFFFSPLCLCMVREWRTTHGNFNPGAGGAGHDTKRLRFSLAALLAFLTYMALGAAAYRYSSAHFVRVLFSEEDRQFLSMSAEPARDHLEWVLANGLYSLPVGCAGWALATSRPRWWRLAVYFFVVVGSCLVERVLPWICGTPHELGAADIVKKGFGIYFSILHDVLLVPWSAAGDHWTGGEFLAIFAAVLFSWLEALRLMMAQGRGYSECRGRQQDARGLP